MNYPRLSSLFRLANVVACSHGNMSGALPGLALDAPVNKTLSEQPNIYTTIKIGLAIVRRDFL